MSDTAVYETVGGVRVPRVLASVWPSGDPWIHVNHGWQKNRCDGMNLLYVDGHVAWKNDPFNTGINYWNGGYGPIDW